MMPGKRSQATSAADPHEIEAARQKLANAFLAVAHGDLLDPQVLKRAALHRLALDIRKAGAV
jgi:hypothetical protein